MDPFEPLEIGFEAAIGFRVECHSPLSEYFNRTISVRFGDMVPRGQHLVNGSIRQTLDAYLSWKHIPTPFIAFFDSWERALRWRNFLIQRRTAKTIVIIAVWLEGKLGVYDARAAAVALGYPRDRLDFHVGEFLVYGGISANEYRIIASLEVDTSPTRPCLLCPLLNEPVPALSAAIPTCGGLWGDSAGFNTAILRQKMLDFTPDPDQMRLCALVLSLGGYGLWLEVRGHPSLGIIHILQTGSNTFLRSQYYFFARRVRNNDGKERLVFVPGHDQDEIHALENLSL
ncbi:hypothetical protein F4821DRAFT_198334 [Hypoxylon rubiginosum]|uniref:Uncharacterized protein n=1 Tax=Hypoxylon rubiginosum TaxID=110542 RepID=A0ACC0CRT5_9PEZI|nr:hypothetical protein F4821DRAFT_198334 [Hypoxylon rubiginosum]